MSTSTLDNAIQGHYRHEAFFYADDDEFMDVTLGFIRDGLADAEPMLVALSATRIKALRGELGRSAARVEFADMDEIGGNPARIIPAWQDFLSDNARPGRRVRGIGEPIWASRTPDELAECHRHEALLNLAFDGGCAWWLVCPYDSRALPAEVIAEARCTHPLVWGERCGEPSTDYRGRLASAEPFVAPLPDPPALVEETTFMLGDLRAVRARVADAARGWGLPEARVADLILAAGEVAANSVRHGGGRGRLRVWFDAGSAVCEIRDAGYIDQPLAGREPPAPDRAGGYGLWLANQVCDLVQVRSSPAGTTIRLHVRAI